MREMISSHAATRQNCIAILFRTLRIRHYNLQSEQKDLINVTRGTGSYRQKGCHWLIKSLILRNLRVPTHSAGNSRHEYETESSCLALTPGPGRNMVRASGETVNICL